MDTVIEVLFMDTILIVFIAKLVIVFEGDDNDND